MSKEFDRERAIRILNHPVRIRIIELLASGPLSWKELSRELRASTGSLYHHLDILEHLVARDSSKRYVLTKLGQDIHEYLNRNPLTGDAEGLNKVIKQKSSLGFVRGLFIPRSVIYFMTTTKSKSIASSVGLSLVVLILMILSKKQLVLFSLSPSQGIVQSAEGFGGSLLALTGLTYIAMRAFRLKPDPVVLLTSASLSFLPLADFAVIVRSLATLGYLGFLADRNALTLVFVFFQAWGAGIFGAGISVTSGLRIEMALLVSLGILYATAIIMFLQGVRFI
jgi:DNA-binding transcriptional ArsR family regulator